MMHIVIIMINKYIWNGLDVVKLGRSIGFMTFYNHFLHKYVEDILTLYVKKLRSNYFPIFVL